MILKDSFRPMLSVLQHGNSDVICALGEMLAAGRPMIKVFESISLSARKQKIRDLATKAANLLKEGQEPAEVFRSYEFLVFSPQVRYLLSCPLSDRVKGKLISCLVARKLTLQFNFFSFYYPFMTLIVGTMSTIALMFFVLPQFREIILSTGLKMPFLLSFFVGIDMFSFNLYFAIFFFALIGIAFLFFYGLKTLFATSSYAEQAKFLYFLAAVDKEERLKVISLASSRVLFPVFCNQLRNFSQALNSGENVSQACETAGFPLTLCWFVTAGLESDNATEMLDNGCQLIGSQYFSRFSMILNLVEVMITVVLGLMLGTMIYTVFSAMMLVLEAGIK